MYKKPPTTTQPSSTTRNTLTTTTATTSTSITTSGSRLSTGALGSQSNLGGRGTSPTPASQSSVYYRLYLEDTHKSNQTGTQTISSSGARPSSPTPSTSTPKTYVSSLSITLGSGSKASTSSASSSSTSASDSDLGARPKTTVYKSLDPETKPKNTPVSNVGNSNYNPEFLKFIGDLDDDINPSSGTSTTSTSSSTSTSDSNLGARPKTSSSLSTSGSDSKDKSTSPTKSSNVEEEASSEKQQANFGSSIGRLVENSLFKELSGKIEKQPFASTKDILKDLEESVYRLSNETFYFELRNNIGNKSLTEEKKKSIESVANIFGEQITDMARTAFNTGIKNFEKSSKPRNFNPYDPRVAAITISNSFGEDVKASSTQQLNNLISKYSKIFR